MADYYTLIRRAIERGDNRTGEARRSVYEKARSALVRQLRSLDPPLSESEITRQRLALEDAIRKVEAEMAEALVRGAATALGRSEEPKPVATPPAAAPPAASAPRPPGLPPLPPRVPPAAPPKLPLPAASPPPASPPVSGRATGGLPPAAEIGTGRNAPARANPLSDLPAREPGPAARDAGRAAAVPEQPMRPEVADTAAEDTGHAGDEPATERHEEEADLPFAPMPQRGSGRPALIAIGVALLLAGGLAVWQSDALVRLLDPEPQDVVQAPEPTAPTPPPATPETPQTGKIEDRVPQEGRIAPGGQPAPPAPPAPGGAGTTGEVAISVAQKAVLYEEEGGEANKGQFHNGTVTWRAEPDESARPALLVRGLVDIPDRGLKLLLTFRRNTDPNFPASHTIELLFEVPKDFAPGGVQNVPGILLKEAEAARGSALAGASAKVTNGFFLIGLMSSDGERSRNLELLRDRSWIDIPILYTNNRRAILTIGKGTPGERAFAQAFQSWTQ